MRRALCISGIVACLIGAVPALALQQLLGVPVKGLQGSMRIERTAYHEGENIRVTLTLTNVSEVPITIDPWPGNWFVQLFDEHIRVIQPKARAVDVLRPLPEPRTLQPGESWSTQVEALRFVAHSPGSTPLWEYAPLKPGTYWLGAEYAALQDPSHPEMWFGGLNCQLVKIEVVATPVAQAPKS